MIEKFDIKSLEVTHDTFFLETFQEKRFGAAFLKAVLPEKLMRELKLDELVVLPRHVSNSIFKGKIADVIYRVPIKKMVSHVDFFAVLEHKSNNDFLTIFQLWGYVQRICEKNIDEAKKQKNSVLKHIDCRRSCQ
ncbi:MAG: Rpn family recombination-promoting nuclease/putative transposase [Thermoguttaceae bacterium]